MAAVPASAKGHPCAWLRVNCLTLYLSPIRWMSSATRKSSGEQVLLGESWKEVGAIHAATRNAFGFWQLRLAYNYR